MDADGAAPRRPGCRAVSEVTCRSCGASATVPIGRLPNVDVFAGRQLAQPLPGGTLRRCGSCGFVFRSPVLDDAAYAALYAAGGTEVWDQQAGREDFRRVRQALGDAPQDVLDVGCYTGDLLATLPAACRRFGVEANPAAAARAAARGIGIVATDWQVLDADPRRYDAIVSCDVIEHVARPQDFLAVLARCLRPGGRLLLTTGDAEAWPWRLAGARFWYAHFPEHVSFVGPRWLRRTAPACGLRVQRLAPFWHGGEPRPAVRARALLSTLAWRLAPAAWAGGRPRLLGGGIAPDHLFVVLMKD